MTPLPQGNPSRGGHTKVLWPLSASGIIFDITASTTQTAQNVYLAVFGNSALPFPTGGDPSWLPPFVTSLLSATPGAITTTAVVVPPYMTLNYSEMAFSDAKVPATGKQDKVFATYRGYVEAVNKLQ